MQRVVAGLRRTADLEAAGFLLRLLAGLLSLAGMVRAAGPAYVIVDSDSCLFCDDGAAVTMLVRSPAQVTVTGITIVAGNVWTAQGAEYMLHVLDLLKHPGVPLFLGASQPLIHTAAMAKEYGRRWGSLEYIGAFGLNPGEVKPAPGPHSPHAPKARRESAVEFLISEIERHPGEVTILEIGPMTNLALALSLRPQIETKIKRLVFMGGNLHAPGNASSMAEFNFWFDPEAARIVLRSRIPEKVMFGLDICNTAPLRKSEFDEIAGAHTPITDLFREDLGNRYPGFLAHPNAIAYMWDSLAAAWLIDPGTVTRSEPHYLDVLTAWGKFYGSTVPLDRRVAPDATPVLVMTGLDFRRAYGLYRELLTKKD